MRRSGGFSLVELMIAALLTAVVVMFLMQTFTTQQRSYVVLDQTVEMQQNSRAISDLLEHDARQAGMLGPRGAAACGTDATTGPDSLYLADSDVIDVNSMSSRLPRYYAKVNGYGGQGQQALTLKAGASLSPDGKPSVDNDGDGVADTDFRVKGGVILMDVHDPTLGVDCGTVVSITPPNQIVVKFENGLNVPPADADYVAIMPAHVYSVDVAKKQLTRDGMVLANDVEDLQVAYFFDVNENHAMDGAATEYPGSAGGGVPQYQSNVWGRDDLREIRMNVVVRTRAEVPGSSSGLFQNTENRQAVATADGYRRRVFTSTVKLRNSAYETATYPE